MTFHLHQVIVYVTLASYALISKLIFDHVYSTTRTVIDEAFHLPQGLAYCRFNFTTWDPKITTLPGLYLLSTILLGPFGLCEIYWLRFVTYAAAVLNLGLFYVWFTYDGPVTTWRRVLSSINLSILPPLYFFSNLYYTDIVSVTSIMILLLSSKLEKHFLASICGMVSVLIRQTNIIWVAMVFGEYFLKHYWYCLKERAVHKMRYKKTENLKISQADFKEISPTLVKGVFVLKNLSLVVWINIFSYATVFITFVLYIIWNGGIVIGDKAAHVAVIHIPQLFYFSLFCIFFNWPHALTFINPCMQTCIKRPLLTVFIIFIMVNIIYWNTLVHPYLLADNRHYTFYIWSRYYEGIPLFRYALIAPYLFGIYYFVSSAYSKDDISFAVVFIPCTILALILQKMIEIRYFFIPFILFRLRLNLSVKLLVLELISHCIINYVTLKIFFEKDIYWADFDYVQKLIW